MKGFVALANIAMGIVQFCATAAGVQVWLGWSAPVAYLVAFLGFCLFQIPIAGPALGTVLGVVGAWEGWGWPFLGAFLLFFWWPVLVFALAGLGFLGRKAK